MHLLIDARIRVSLDLSLDFKKLNFFMFFKTTSTGECVPPAFVAGGGQTRQAERGMGVNILEDERNRIALLQ
jgi:hypothetical protein